MKGSKQSLKKLERQKDLIYKKILKKREKLLVELQEDILELMVAGYKGSILKEFNKIENKYITKRDEINDLEYHRKHLITQAEERYRKEKREREIKKGWLNVRRYYEDHISEFWDELPALNCPECRGIGKIKVFSHEITSELTRIDSPERIGICSQCQFAGIRSASKTFDNPRMYFNFASDPYEF